MQAVDAWRTFAGLAHTWTSYAPLTGTISFNDGNSLVTALNAARTASGLSAFSFTSSPSPAVGVAAYAFHVQQLRNVVK